LIVGLDVDDVLLDLTTVWLEEYNREYDDSLDKSRLHTWDLYKYVKPECGKRIYGFLSPGLYDRVQPFPGAVEFVQAIRDMGHEPRYITACGDPKKTAKVAAFALAKTQCLHRHGIKERSEILIAKRDKSRAPVDMLIDDRIDNVESFRNGLGVLFTQPWNRSSFLTRARHYADCLDLIERYAKHVESPDSYSSNPAVALFAIRAASSAGLSGDSAGPEGQ
jgi:5'(3')-deoxyribonucleotidase